LLRREEYAAALASAPAALRRHFSVFVRANELERSRIGIIVGKKSAPRAVDRNRIKRMVREAFRNNRQCFGGADLVVLARRCPQPSGWESARAELMTLFAQLAAQLRPRDR
jgi:ribonuclease P protein component